MSNGKWEKKTNGRLEANTKLSRVYIPIKTENMVTNYIPYLLISKNN